MKKLFLFLGLGSMSLGYSQQYPYGGYTNDNYYNSGGYNNGYSFYDDNFYSYATNNFPDDYFYNYPTDYYANNYYEDMYNDYRNSISNVNWNVFFRNNNLNSQQINLIISLNNRFANFNAWNSYYGMNPSRWYYDRFYLLQQILGPQIFVIFQNSFYNGYSPVVYYQNHWTNYYRPRYVCAPKYKSININIYRNDRKNFFQQHAPQYVNRNTNTSGFRNEHASNNNGQSVAASTNGRRTQNTVGRTIGNNTPTRNSTINNGVRNSAVRPSTAPVRNDNVRNIGSGSGIRNNSATTTATRGGGNSGGRYIGR